MGCVQARWERTDEALGDRGEWTPAAEALGALGLTGFVCDAAGWVLAGDAGGVSRGGRLAGGCEAETRRLLGAIAACAQGGAAEFTVLRDSQGGRRLLELSPLPRGAVLVVLRTPRAQEARTAAMARALFGLTRAESLVAAALAEGVSAGAIAERLGVSIGTVRCHIRRSFDKAGVRSQGELTAALLSRG